MFENIFGKKEKSPKEEKLVLPDKEVLAARAAENGGGRAEFPIAEESVEERDRRIASENDVWSTQMSGRDEANFNREENEAGKGEYSPIDYVPVEPEIEDDQKAA